LEDISFDLTPGESVAIVGHTGAGKTTLINILGRQYDIQKGDILIDDTLLKKWDLSDPTNQGRTPLARTHGGRGHSSQSK